MSSNSFKDNVSLCLVSNCCYLALCYGSVYLSVPVEI